MVAYHDKHIVPRSEQIFNQMHNDLPISSLVGSHDKAKDQRAYRLESVKWWSNQQLVT